MTSTDRFIQENETMQVNICPGADYNLNEVINDVYRSINGQFLMPTWSDGMKREFFDLSRVFATNIKNSTDIDTKDLGIQAENQQGVKAVGLLREIIKHHLKVNDYATLFNDVRDELVDFGHVILKKTSEGTRTVDLRNVIRPAHEQNIQKGGIIEKHVYSYQDMLERKHRWKDAWNEIEALWERMKQQGLSSFVVYEHWLIDEFDDQVTKGCIYSLDRNLLKPEEGHNREDWSPTVELERFKTPWTSRINNKEKKDKLQKADFLIDGELPLFPYQDIRLVPVKGRWMGAGVYEITAPLRRAYNRTLNTKLRYDEVQTKGTFLHTKGINGKSLTQEAINALKSTGVVELQNGAQLEQLRIQSLTNEFLATADKFFEFGRQLLGLTAQGTGEDLPANMPATTAAINQARAKTLFDAILETQGIAWRNWFSMFEFRDIIDNLTKQDWVKIQGNEEDIAEVIEPFAKNYLAKRFEDARKLAGELDILPQIDQILDKVSTSITKALSNSGMSFVQFKKKMIKNADFFVEFFITNEAFDKTTTIQELQTLRQDALTNPNSSLSPKKLEAEILNNLSQDSKRFERDAEEQANISNPLLNANLPQTTAPQATPEAVQAPQAG